MNRTYSLLASLALAGFLAGCSSDTNDLPTPTPPPPPPPPPELANVRVVHASADAPTVDILANGEVLNGLTGVDYQGASTLFNVEAGTYTLAVEANTPDGNAQVLSAELMLMADTNYNVFAVGSVTTSTLELLPVAIAEDPVAAGNVQVQVVHAAANAPMVDVYVTAPDADLSAAQPLDTLDFKDATGFAEVAAGDYRIRITPAGASDVVFDSGTVALPADADLLIAATTNTGTGASPVTLLISDGTNSFKIWDSAATADVRVVHAISDAPTVDVIANNAVLLVDALSFPEATDYVSVMPGDYVLDIVADADNSIVAADDIPVTLEQGIFYTAIANNALAAPELDLLIDMPRAIATAAQVRIVHASPDAGPVDIYVTATMDISGSTPAFSNVPYTTEAIAETGYVSLAAGEYVVTVTPTGTMDVAIQTPMLSLETGKIYTAIARNGDNPGDAPSLILLDDFVE